MDSRRNRKVSGNWNAAAASGIALNSVKTNRISEQNSSDSESGNDRVEGMVQLEAICSTDTDAEEKSYYKSCHPLENPLILSNIFRHLEVEDLKACRSVCRSWNDEASYYLLEKAVLEIDMTSSQSGRTAKDFLSKVMSHPGVEFPCNNLHLVGADLRDLETIEIFELYGHFIKELTLDALYSTSDSEERISKRHLLKLSQQCPNLESLHMIDFPDKVIHSGFPKLMKAVMLMYPFSQLKRLSFSADGYFCPLDAQFIMDFMDIAPNLTELRFQVGDDEAFEEIISALELRPKAMEKIRVLKFGNVSGSTLCKSHVFTLLHLRLFSLTELEIGLLGVDVSSQTFKFLLEEISPTLQILKINGRGKGVGKLRLRFPEMKNLRHLEINDIRTTCVGSIRFLRKFPNLKICNLNRDLSSDMSFIEDQKFWRRLFPNEYKTHELRHLSLEELALPRHLTDIDVIINTKEYFPALKRLSLDFDSDDLLPGVIESFKGSSIEVLNLKLVPTGVTFDSSLTGILSGDCERMMEDKTYWPVSSNSNWKVWSSLADWKCLRKLSIISKTSDYFPITGVAICHGFALARSITSLELGNFEIKDVHILELMHNMPLCKLRLQACKIIQSAFGGPCGIKDRIRQFFPSVHFEIESPIDS